LEELTHLVANANRQDPVVANDISFSFLRARKLQASLSTGTRGILGYAGLSPDERQLLATVLVSQDIPATESTLQKYKQLIRNGLLYVTTEQTLAFPSRMYVFFLNLQLLT
jgi:hypothetical protein